MNNKFEKVCKALEEKTRKTDNYITLTKNVYAGSKGKYATKNLYTNHTSIITFKTLDEVVKEYNLNI